MGGGGNSSLGLTGTCRPTFVGRPILEDFRSIFIPILRFSEVQSLSELPENKFHFTSKVYFWKQGYVKSVLMMFGLARALTTEKTQVSSFPF